MADHVRQLRPPRLLRAGQAVLRHGEGPLAGARVVGHEKLALLGRALGVEDADVPPLTGPYADKVAAILASAKGDTFRRVIDDYYELVRRLASDPDNRAAKRTAQA